MKRILGIILIICVVCACSSDDDHNKGALNTEKEVTSFNFNANANLGLTEDEIGVIEENKVTIRVPSGTVVTNLIADVTLSEGATISPDPALARDYRNPVTYRVTAEDGSTRFVVVTVIRDAFLNARITNFNFRASSNSSLTEDSTGIIENNTITVNVPGTAVLTNLIADVTLSEGASISPDPTQARDYSTPVTYRVTAEDGSTQDFVVTVTKDVASAAFITNFSFQASSNSSLTEDVLGIINETTITASVSTGTVVTNLIADVTLSEGATISPDPTQARDYSTSVTYRVTAEDGSTQDFVVTVLIADERSILIELYNANSSNTLGWDITTTDIENWEGVTVTDGRVTELNFALKNLTTIPASFSGLIHLTSLDLFKNNISSLPESFYDLTNLTVLRLADNNFTSISERIGDLTKLTKLDLSQHDFTSLPISIGNLTDLTELKLFRNEFSSLPEVLYSLTNLTYLDLNNNNFTSLPENIGNLVNLKTLDMHGNDLTSLPTNFGNLIDLEVLNLSSNNFSSLPEFIGNLTKLTRLLVVFNELTALPNSIGSLTNLNQLYLSDNKLTTLPESLTNLTNLEFIAIDSNDIESSTLSNTLCMFINNVIVNLKDPGVCTPS